MIVLDCYNRKDTRKCLAFIAEGSVGALDAKKLSVL